MADDSLTTDDSAHPVVPSTTGAPLRAVMFADMIGFTRLSERMTPADAIALLTGRRFRRLKRHYII